MSACVPDLYRLAFMPGQFRCPKCGFQLSKQTISVAQGCIGTTPEDRESVPCVNCDTMMVHVTYREQLEVYAARLKEEFDRFDAHTKAVAEFLSELHAIMVDPFAEGTLKVDQMMLVLRATALQQRETDQSLRAEIGLERIKVYDLSQHLDKVRSVLWLIAYGADLPEARKTLATSAKEILAKIGYPPCEHKRRNEDGLCMRCRAPKEVGRV